MKREPSYPVNLYPLSRRQRKKARKARNRADKGRPRIIVDDPQRPTGHPQQPRRPHLRLRARNLVRAIIVIESSTHLSIETWKRILSRVDFCLEREIDAPHLQAHLDTKDTKCPRPAPARTVEDMI